jgi:pyruvate kinase
MIRETRLTKIVFTIGPATESESVLERLIQRGVDVCRFNMAHADEAWFRRTVQRVKRCCERVNRQVALLMDVKGPEIRTRDVQAPIALQEGDAVVIAFAEATVISQRDTDGVVRLGVNYPEIAEDLHPGGTVLIDSGLIRLTVEAVQGSEVWCRVAVPGNLGSRRHVNLPGVRVKLPALTAKDRHDIRVGVEEGVDFFALSFVREARDLFELRRELYKWNSQAQIIAKIEDASGVALLNEILDASEGLMIARGDLGIEVPFEQLPIFQRRAVDRCLSVGKPVIVATHMLESMIHSPVPTRAEITDVSNAVREQADCVMLSGETSVGKYPEQCLDVLNRILLTMEKQMPGNFRPQIELTTPKEKMIAAAGKLAESLGKSALIVFTRSGHLVRLLAAQRPKETPIFAFTDEQNCFRQMLILWGVEPFLMDLQGEPEQVIQHAFDWLKRGGWGETGDPVVIITNVLGAGRKIIDSLEVRTIE